jgi:hypothetical protein
MLNATDITHFTRRLLFLAAVFFISSSAHAQLVETPAIISLMEKWKEYNAEHQEVYGWRIQILATIDRRQMEAVMRRYESKYPDYPIHTTHVEPYFHLKTGAFVSMGKAQAFMRSLQDDYPSAILVRDNFKMEEVLLYDQ